MTNELVFEVMGYVEIGGRRADLVIANPAGINVNGGGFINATAQFAATRTANWHFQAA